MVKLWFSRDRLTPETPVTASRQVLSGAPLVTIIHQNDGTWQFLCDQPKVPTDIRVVHFQHIIDLHSAALQFTGLHKGDVAVEDVRGAWHQLHFESDAEIEEWLGAVGPPES
jgi:hypothetical protein